MKTKNIFRMLLVAALLMGANNVKADDIWTTPQSNDADNGTTFNIPADNFNNLVRKGSKLRFYITVLNQYNWQLGFSINNSAISPDFSSFDGFKYGNYWGYQTVADKIIDEDNERYLEVICSETTASNLLDYGLDVTINHLSLSKVTLINEAVKYRTVTFNVDGSEYESKTIEVGDPIELPMPPTKTGYVYTGWANLPSVMPDEDITVEATFREGVEQTAWEDGTFSLSDDMYNSGLTIDNSFFNGVSGTIYVRIYGYNTIATGWRVKIGYFDGSSVQTPTFGNYNQGQIDSYSSESLNGSLLYGYIEFILDSTELGLLAQNGAKIGGSAFTATKVSVIASSATAAPKYTVSYTAEVYDENQTKLGTVEMRNDVVEYEADATVTFYVTPEEGYEIDAVTVTGDSYEETLTAVSTDSEGITIYRFTMPNKDVTINVTFKVAIVKYAVETIASPSEGGSITLVGDETRFAEGDPVSFTVTPNAGYQIVTLSVTSNDNNVECSFANGAYSFTMPAAPVTITATFEIRTISVTIGTHGAATFSDAEAVAIPEGLTAFYAKEVDDNMVKLEEIITGFIPANTGVVLRGEPGTYDVQLATSTVSAITGNLLVGVTTVDEYECKSANQYVLTYHEGTGLVFAQTSSAVPAQVQYGQAYLQWTATAGSRLRLSFGESTGISNIEAETTNDGVIYNLRGQRVENPTKGLYIINGKKVVIK